MSLALDAAGRPAITLVNPLGLGPTATLEIDDKGAHVKLDRPGGASAYLFLNDAGASGLVLIDAAGKRRLNAIVAAGGAVTIERLNDDGEPCHMTHFWLGGHAEGSRQAEDAAFRSAVVRL